MVSIGPLTIPVWLFAAAGSLAAGFLALRAALRSHPRVRRRVADLAANAAMAFVLAWKLAPVLRAPGALFSDPLPLLMAPPGPWGLAVGAAAAAAVLAWGLGRRRRLRRVALLPLALVAGITVAGTGTAAVAGSFTRAARPAPPLDLALFGGGRVSLGDLRGKVVVVNFWATWCPPCRAEMPELVAFAGPPGVPGAVLLCVDLASTERSLDAVEAFVRERAPGLVVPLDSDGAAAAAWGVRVVPTTFVVSPRGEVAAHRTGAVDAAWLRRTVRRAARG